MNSSTFSGSAGRAGVSAAGSRAASLSAMLLGAFFIFLIGFSHIDVVHNAAHDTRHSSAFPCH
ncbi:MAG: CbtB-domain containing protein [Pseudomonadota bacterium]|nr:CbtB-domain containing protein [Pseudomonadota bacterium]MDE3038000.1 CbtB-domain containing protein [Pseudomonadota bacterium]